MYFPFGRPPDGNACEDIVYHILCGVMFGAAKVGFFISSGKTSKLDGYDDFSMVYVLILFKYCLTCIVTYMMILP